MKLQTRPNRGGAPDLPPESSPASTWDPKKPTEPDSPNDPTNSLETHGEVDDRVACRLLMLILGRRKSPALPFPINRSPRCPRRHYPPFRAATARERLDELRPVSYQFSGPNTDN